MQKPAIIVLSDLHLTASDCRIKTPSQLAPLLEGASDLVLSGDTYNTVFSGSTGGNRLRDTRACFEEFIAKAGIRLHYVTGNHDPDISDRHYWFHEPSGVFVIHGDLFTEDIAPWSETHIGVREHIRSRAAADAVTLDSLPLDSYLSAVRGYMLEFMRLKSRKTLRRPRPTWFKVLEKFLHPGLLANVLIERLRCFRSAAAFLERYDLSPTLLAFGHYHYAAVKKTDAATLAGLGSFMPVSRPLAVVIRGGEFRIHAPVRKAAGWVIGDETGVGQG